MKHYSLPVLYWPGSLNYSFLIVYVFLKFFTKDQKNTELYNKNGFF